ncbi:MAG: phosphoenolpyruvate kinase, partial [Myxococcales bacterium]|nr:phosphoenolpyruvate kinase [Myxococcales bacterium]
MKLSLNQNELDSLAKPLVRANQAWQEQYPGDSGARQPVHTVYGGAHLFKADTAKRLGELSVRAFEKYGAHPVEFADALGMDAGLSEEVHARVLDKLKREAVEDFRIDFEDGYGNRPDSEEDGHAVTAAQEVAKGMAAGTLPPFIGIRIKPFTEELRARSMRTLDAFLTTLAGETGGKLPHGFVVTLPKVTVPEQVTALVDLFDALEPRLGIEKGALKLEIMVETTQSIVDHEGRAALPILGRAGGKRVVAAHFGTYDFTASCNITSTYQNMSHPSCHFARQMMKMAFAGTGMWLSDGATNVMPVEPHRQAKGGPALTESQIEENRAVVHRAWKMHYDHVRESLMLGFYQGWDLHPAQLP